MPKEACGAPPPPAALVVILLHQDSFVADMRTIDHVPMHFCTHVHATNTHHRSWRKSLAMATYGMSLAAVQTCKVIHKVDFLFFLLKTLFDFIKSLGGRMDLKLYGVALLGLLYSPKWKRSFFSWGKVPFSTAGSLLRAVQESCSVTEIYRWKEADRFAFFMKKKTHWRAGADNGRKDVETVAWKAHPQVTVDGAQKIEHSFSWRHVHCSWAVLQVSASSTSVQHAYYVHVVVKKSWSIFMTAKISFISSFFVTHTFLFSFGRSFILFLCLLTWATLVDFDRTIFSTRK